MAALDPLSLYPDFDDDVGGTEWFRTTVIASDLFERCPGRAWVRNVTEYAPTWKCKPIQALNTCPCALLTKKQIDGML
jgi:hypothetical protein